MSKRKPRKKQAQALKRIRGKRAFALFMEQRTGKSKVVCDDWEKMVRANVCTDLLVIAPGGAYRTWETAVVDDIDDDILKNSRVMTWSSDATSKQEVINFLDYRGTRILLVNVEALSVVDRARDLCEAFLKRGKAVCAVDESVIIGNPKAICTKYIVNELAPLAKARRILSGLPTPRDPLQLWGQFEFLDPAILGFSDYQNFEERHAHYRMIKVGTRKVKIVVGFKHIPDLNKKIEPYVFRCLVKDCYDLPPATYLRREVTMPPEQARLYAELKKYATTQLSTGEHVTTQQVITQMLRLHQLLCGRAVDEQGVVHQIKENRTKEVLSILDDCAGKAIIWCSYEEDIIKVSEAIEDHFKCRVARFWGGNEKTREDEERKFKTLDAWPYIVATPDAGRYSRDWSAANTAIYYSSRNNLDHRIQSESRPIAVNKTQSILYHDLVVPHTVDEGFLRSMREKMELSDMVTGDDWREWVI